MERNVNKVGLVNLLVLLAVGTAGVFLAFSATTLAGLAGLVFFCLAFLIIAISYFQMRLEESERSEKMEFEELNRTAAPSSSLFAEAPGGDVLPARRAREQFERFFVPGFTILLLAAQGFA